MCRNLCLPLLATFAALTAAVACAGSDDEIPLIFAAASLADVLTEAADAYEAETGERVEFNFGGSIALANQVARLDAPADGLILAGQRPVDMLIEAGAADPTTLRRVANNSLVVVSNDETQLASLNEIMLRDTRIAIADPDLAPAGQYAQEALTSAGLWDEIQGQVIPTLDVRAALAAASSGSAEYAIVYRTDAQTEPGLHIVLQINSELHDDVVYLAVATTGSDRAEAADRFFEFLQNSDTSQIFSRHGFSSFATPLRIPNN